MHSKNFSIDPMKSVCLKVLWSKQILVIFPRRFLLFYEFDLIVMSYNFLVFISVLKFISQHGQPQSSS